MSQVFFQGREEGPSQRGIRAGFETIMEGKRRFLGGAVWCGVMVEFGRRKKLCPFGWVVGAEDLEIGLEFLIGSFGLSVGLRMVGSGESDIIVEKMG